MSSRLYFSLKRSLMFLVSCIPRYFILFVAIVNGSSFLIWLSLCLLLVYTNACDFCTLILYPETLLKLRYHLKPVRMAIIKKSGDNRCWTGCGEKGTLLHCWWECKWVQPLWKTVWRFLKALEIEIPFDPAIPLLGIYPKEYKSFYYKDTRTRMFIAALSTIAKTWNQPKCPSMID